MDTDLITFGESMIVFIAENEGSFTDIKNFSKGIAGAELNVSIGLARLGHKVGYITRLGDDIFGTYIQDIIDKEGIFSNISRESNHSTGFYFKTKVKNGDPEVHYFRKNSAASQLNYKDIEDTDFKNAKILHITGITPALSETALDATYHAIDKAKEHNMLITFDPNIRTKLWIRQNKMRRVLNDIASRCDIILPGIKEGRILTKKDTKEEIADFYLKNGSKAVIIKDGAKGAYLKTLDEEKEISGFNVSNIVDTVGAGDGFATGILSGLLEGNSYEDAIIRGNAIGAIMVTSKQDNKALPTQEELDNFINTHTRN